MTLGEQATSEKKVYSADGLWVRVKVEREGTKFLGETITGGMNDIRIRVDEKYRVTPKARNDADPKLLTNAVRDRMTGLLGSPPSVLPWSKASGLIEFNWEGPASISSPDLLSKIEGTIVASDIGNVNSVTRGLESMVNEPARVKEEDVSWMNQSLHEAKDVVSTHHTRCDCDPNAFFSASTFELYVQRDKSFAFAYIRLGHGSHFPIGVHPILTEPTPYNQRALVVVLVHELLHALHPAWGHERINPQEKLLANKGGYFDALVELQRKAVSGEVRFCGD